jgi:hypothetical protein
MDGKQILQFSPPWVRAGCDFMAEDVAFSIRRNKAGSTPTRKRMTGEEAQNVSIAGSATASEGAQLRQEAERIRDEVAELVDRLRELLDALKRETRV